MTDRGVRLVSIALLAIAATLTLHRVVFGPETLRVAMGISRTLVFPDGFGAIASSDPDVATLRALYDPSPRELLIVPQRPGRTEISIYDPSGEVVVRRLFIAVAEDGDGKIANEQMVAERAAGTAVETVAMQAGIVRTVPFPRPVGPIYLTDPSVLDYRRSASKGEPRSLSIQPKRPGRTDLTVHDEEGRVQARYYIDVIAR